MTKEEARSLVQQLIDDPSGERWPTERLDLLIQTVMDPLWVDIFRVAGEFLIQTDEVATLTSPGYADLATDLTQRLFRVRHVTRNSREYTKGSRRATVIQGGEAKVYTPYTFLKLGTQLHLFPYETTPAVEVEYSYRPPRFTDLEDEESVTWPDGHDMVYIFKAAASALGKGAAEDGSTFAQDAKDALYKMLGELERWTTGPIILDAGDSPIDWGGT